MGVDEGGATGLELWAHSVTVVSYSEDADVRSSVVLFCCYVLQLPLCGIVGLILSASLFCCNWMVCVAKERRGKREQRIDLVYAFSNLISPIILQISQSGIVIFCFCWIVQ